MKWILNFSASPTGGGLKRLQETARWFSGHGGATFLVHSHVLELLSGQSTGNRYIGISQSKLMRLFADGQYLAGVVRDLGGPDVYFSYGIPLFQRVARINWLHASNALTLTRARHGMPLRRYLEHQILGGRIRRSLTYAQIVSAESEFSLALLGKGGHASKKLVLENGCDEILLRTAESPLSAPVAHYAITVGTAPYKRLPLAVRVFHELRRNHPDIESLKIVGDESHIPAAVLAEPRVEALGSGFSTEELYRMLRQAEFYISASEIENSSVAALEGLLLSHHLALSDIPSHRETIRGLPNELFELPQSNRFLLVKGHRRREEIKVLSWDDVARLMHDVVAEYDAAATGSR